MVEEKKSEKHIPIMTYAEYLALMYPDRKEGNNANTVLAEHLSFKQLDWSYFTPPKISNSYQKIVAQHDFKLPEWMCEKKECNIDITEVGNVYYSTMWLFNRGIKIVDASDLCETINDCIELVNQRINNLRHCF